MVEIENRCHQRAGPSPVLAGRHGNKPHGRPEDLKVASAGRSPPHWGVSTSNYADLRRESFSAAGTQYERTAGDATPRGAEAPVVDYEHAEAVEVAGTGSAQARWGLGAANGIDVGSCQMGR